MKIKKLQAALINKIAAGEVVERPASVLKELLENSIDAGADSISIHIEEGGTRLIRVVDNGEGMVPDDMNSAFTRYATSKIKSLEDLDAIHTLGFRGEALPSIASVSRIGIFSKTHSSETGHYIEMDGGNIIDQHERGGPSGTNISVKELFFNVPGRKKFLKSSRSEYLEILDHFYSFALMYPEIRFRFFNEGIEKWSFPPSSLAERLALLFKDVTAKDLLEIRHEGEQGMSLTGVVSKPRIFRKNKKRLYVSMNGRMLRDQKLIYYLTSAYEPYMMKGTFPVGIINLTVPPSHVDVNVHPRKTEVRFLTAALVRDLIFYGVSSALKDEVEVFTPESTVSFSSTSPGSVQSSLDFSVSPSGINGQTPAHIPHQRIELFGVPVSLIGRIKDTYLIFKGQDELYLMDQHAADERVLFEKISKEMKRSVKLSQELLIPFELDRILADHHIKFLANAGFDISDDGDRITAVPPWLALRFPLDGIGALLESLEEENFSFMDWVKDLACKSAVKGGDDLSFELISEILKDLCLCENPYQCPHGRPTLIKFSSKDLDKMFKRT